jgi:hypothetical protein
VVNTCCTYSSNVFCIGDNITFSTNLDGKTIFEHNLYVNLWNQMDPTINVKKPLIIYITSFRKPVRVMIFCKWINNIQKSRHGNQCNVGLLTN